MMKKRTLRNLEVNPIGMGCMGFSHGYGDIPTEEYSIQAIQMAHDFGCDFYDTAEAYSPRQAAIGHNELIIGKAIKFSEYAKRKEATDAQIALAWMLHKYPNVIPIPGSQNKERILENLGAWNVELTDEEFQALDTALNALNIKGFRGHVEQQEGTMADWGKRK